MMLRNCQLAVGSKRNLWRVVLNHDSCPLKMYARGVAYQHSHQEHEKEEFHTRKLYNSHIPTTGFQKILISAGGGLMALYHPERHDMVAAVGETTGQTALPKIYQKMMKDPEGQEILRDRPIINSSTIDIPYLRSLPEDTFGYHYVKFLDGYEVTPDSRQAVHFVDDLEMAYIIRRYREVHDLVHTLLGMPTNMPGEVAVKWVEGIQTGLPMCLLGGLLFPVRFTTKQMKHYTSILLPWSIRCGFQSKFLMNVYYEKRWTQSMESLREELNIPPPPHVPQKKKVR